MTNLCTIFIRQYIQDKLFYWTDPNRLLYHVHLPHISVKMAWLKKLLKPFLTCKSYNLNRGIILYLIARVFQYQQCFFRYIKLLVPKKTYIN